MRRTQGSLLAAILLLTFPLSALARVDAQRLDLDPAAGAEPALELLELREDGATLSFTLPWLDLDELVQGNEFYQALSIPGGGMAGAEGAPGLPTLSRLIAIPAGATVTLRTRERDRSNVGGMRLLPVQRDGADAFTIDRAAYSEPASSPEVLLGEPALLRHQSVLPITISPVGYDPASGELVVATRIEIELEFSGGDRSSAPAFIPESFDRMLADAVLGYRRDESTQVGPGSYLMIYPNVANVLTTLQPLIDWRERQGYNVVVVSDAVTGTSTAAIKSYIQTAYDTWNPPLEHVALVGDASGGVLINCWNEGLSGYNGEGDHYYAMLEGDDVIADVHIGRLSVTSTTELAAIVDKIVTYETNPPTSDAGWFSRAGLAGDPSSSGITTIYVNQWVKQHLLAHDYTQVDTLWSPNATAMRNSINQGLSVWGYRGWLGMSGMSTGYITALANGYELPYAVVVTCGTGSFKSETTCQSEAFLRAPSGGGFASVGTATTGTHTRYNNCYYQGCWDGMLNGGDPRVGVGHSRGKLELYNQYQISQPNIVEIWSVWNNLMGDPASEMWTAYPGQIAVDHPASLPVGANAVALNVSSGGSPLAGARVALVKDGEVRSTGYTDGAGDALLPISGYTAGTLLVTVLSHDRFPYRGSLTLGTATQFAGFEAATIDDDISGGSIGNSDGVVNGAETVEMPVALRNHGSSTAGNVTAILTSADPFVTITDGSESFGDIPAGAVVWSAEDFDFEVAAGVPDLHVLKFELVASSGVQSWTSVIELTAESADLVQEAFTWSGGALDPGEGGTLSVTLRNGGSIAAAATTGTLTSTSPWIVISDGSGAFGSIGVGGTGENGADPFAFDILSDCFQGHLATFQLAVTFNGQAQDLVEFSLPVGTASSDDPVGPDAYGYYAFDNTDVGYLQAPAYNWVEIDPNFGGAGASVGLTDFGWEQDDTETLPMPFDFQYYGVSYDRISICSNGWAAMGETSLEHYRNWSIPSSGSPNAMIAPYWDDLYQTGTNVVYHWFDAANHRYVVQWSRVKNGFSNATENFEMILYDPAYTPTVTGDGVIEFQYETVNNTDTTNGYGTVGIQSPDRRDGVLYTYWNAYPAAAAPLAAGRAIRFQPATALIGGTLSGDVSNTSNGGTPIEGVVIRVVEIGQNLFSQASGHYSGTVQVGDWTVRAEHESFEPVQVSGIGIVEDQVTNLDFALIDILGPYVTGTTALSHTDDPVGPYSVTASIADYSALGDLNLRYRVNGGGDFWLPLTEEDPGSGVYGADIPGHPLNTRIDYWIEAEDVAGNTTREPAGVDTYTFFIVPSQLVLDDDMEADLGWTVGDAGDGATTGIWTRVEPYGVFNAGIEVQPEEDASADGSLCFITGNGENGQQGTDDVDEGKTTLLSPSFDLSGFVGVNLSYRRWYTNDTGNNPGTEYWLVQVSGNGVDWVDLENTNVSERSWAARNFRVEDYVELTTTVRFRFIAADYPPGSLVEAGVDEFLINGFLPPDATGLPGDAAPVALTLLPNLPNPFNPKTSIRFGLPREEQVTLRVYDASGRLVRSLIEKETYPAGFHAMDWSGRDDRGRPLSSGIYFARLSAGGAQRSDKMVLLK